MEIILEKSVQYSEEHKVDKSVIMAVVGAINSKIDYDVFEELLKEFGKRTV